MGTCSKILGATVALLLAGCGAEEARRPDIVLIVSDDQDWEHLGFLGNERVATPTVDRLAEAGAVFPVAHVAASRCRASLASVLTSRWPHQHGIFYNDGPRQLTPGGTLPELLAGAGYRTYVAGKFWEGDPASFGFEREAPEGKRFAREGQEDLVRFLTEASPRDELFVWWAPRLPHYPYDSPEEYRQRFATAPVEPPTTEVLDPAAYAADERAVMAMEAWFDDCLAELVDALERSGRLERTLFCFLIDNGVANGHHSKGTVFEKGVRTPIFFSWPGHVRAGSHPETLVSAVDVLPTLLDYAGVAPPAGIEGVSLRPVIEGGAGGRAILFGAGYPRRPLDGPALPADNVYALYARTPRWKYVLYVSAVRNTKRHFDDYTLHSLHIPALVRPRGDEDLYDLAADPHERVDLADRPEHAELRQELRREVLAWWSATGGGRLDLP